MKCPLHIAELSDIHLGATRTPTPSILKGLFAAFPDNTETGQLDVIFMPGDLFDKSLPYSSINVKEIELWVSYLLRLCKKYNIALRIMEGTPSHDRRQSRVFPHLNKLAKINADIKYIDTLMVDFDQSLDATILYVPDEWHPDPDQVWADVQTELAKHNLQQVDFALTHGMYKHQVPANVMLPAHDPERYLAITKHLIFNGHIHKQSQYKRLLTAGSMDRLAHGEEEDKGYYRVCIDENQTQIKFVTNPYATVYRTLDISGLSIEDALVKIQATATDVAGSNYRLSGTSQDPLQAVLEKAKEYRDDCRWTTKTIKAEKVSNVAMVKPVAMVEINQQNLVRLCMERINNEQTSDRIKRFAEQLLTQHL